MVVAIGQKSRWKLAPIYRVDDEDLSPMLVHLLSRRGIYNPKSFFENPYKTHDPFLIPDMDKAVERIRAAIANKEKVAIYSDFDSDGLSAGAVLFLALREYIDIAKTIIPQREEGHGLTHDKIDELRESNVQLIITVDCGVTNIDEVRYAKSLGMDIIVTDHHEPRDTGELPDCLVVNPNRHDSAYPFGGLCGVGVAYQLVVALLNKQREDLMDLVALGTIADVVPVRDENRGFVIKGLQQMRRSSRIGLNTLLTLANIDIKKMNAATVAFSVAPRINAANRLADPYLAYRLLISENYSEAENIAQELGDLNERRKEMLDSYLTPILKEWGHPSIFAEAVEEEFVPPVIIVCGDWPGGLSGLIAGKLAETYDVPVIAASTDGKAIAASARSIPGINIVALLELAKEHGAQFIKYGGHKGAAGFVVDAHNFDTTKQYIEEAAKEYKPNEKRQGSTIVIDAEIPFDRVSMYSIDQIEKIGPFGHGFPEPLFVSRGVSITNQKKIGNGKHLSFKINDIRGVMFNHDEQLETVNSPIDIVYHMEANNFRGYPQAEVRLRDWQFSE